MDEEEDRDRKRGESSVDLNREIWNGVKKIKKKLREGAMSRSTARNR